MPPIRPEGELNAYAGNASLKRHGQSSLYRPGRALKALLAKEVP